MRLELSREVLVKIASHAWNVLPLECFGVLLGKTAPLRVFAALPVSHTAHWQQYNDRWSGMEEKLPQAFELASAMSIKVVGFYASTDVPSDDEYPIPPWLWALDDGVFALYSPICCKAHSGYGFYTRDGWLERQADYIVCPGKRLDPEINQRRVLAQWTARVGYADYSNHADTEYLRLYGKPLPTREERSAARLALKRDKNADNRAACVIRLNLKLPSFPATAL